MPEASAGLPGAGGSAQEWMQANRRAVAALLTEEPHVQNLSEQESEDSTNKFISYRRLRAYSLYRRMCSGQTCRCIKTGIRNSIKAYASVIIFNIFQKPVNSIVGVAAFVNLCFVFFIRDIRSYFKIMSFAHIAPAHILVNENVFFMHQRCVWA